MQKIVLPCAKGSEQVLCQEAEALGLQQTKVGVAVVSGIGDLETAYRLCLWSRVASRVLWILQEDSIENPEELYQLARTVAWDEHLSAQTTFAVNFNGTGQGIRNTQFGALKVKDAIVDTLREVIFARPNVDAKNPDIRIDAHLRKGKLTLALDLSGGGLHQRGYRWAQGVAPLKEHLAATLLYRSNWEELAKKGYNLIDPMCGSGTILLEALLMAADIAPALQRPHFGFEHWQSHKPAIWKRLIAEAKERREIGLSQLQTKIWGFDSDGNTLSAARENAQRLGLSSYIHFEKRDLQQLTAQPGYGEQGIILTNPPYGERLGHLAELLKTYETLGSVFKTFPENWQMAVISSNVDMLKRLRLRKNKSYQAFNGSLEAQIVLYSRQDQPENEDIINNPPQIFSPHAQMFANRLQKNLKTAKKAAAKLKTNAYRLYDQDMPEYAVAIDIYGDFVHVQEYAPPKIINPEKAKQRLFDVIRVIPEVLNIPTENIILKTRQRQSGNAQYHKQNEKEEYFTVYEGEAKFLVNLRDYLDTGLFLDHRPMRRKIYQETRGKRVLNLFCYTGSVSVQAALGGASYTTSVDLSKNYLTWAERNFAENHLDQRHRTIKADVLTWLAEGDSKFDLIFCDPPTFSNTKKENRTFDVQKDHVSLIHLCMNRLADKGVLYFSNNYRGFKLSSEITTSYICQDISQMTLDFDFLRRPNIHKVWKIEKSF